MSIIASLTLLAAAGTSRLGFMTAGDLVDRCNDNATASISSCFAYVTAVYDTMRAYEIWLNQREFCVPATITQSELRRTFIDYVTRNPGSRGNLAASGVAIALKETYRCPDVEAPSAQPPTLPQPAKSAKP